MISKTAEYALRAIVVLAKQEGQFVTRQEIARQTMVAQEYLVKVLARLARCKLVQVRRGATGGYGLVVPKEKLTVWQVISCIDPIQPISECPLNLAGHRLELCPLHSKIRRVTEEVIASFSSVTISDLVAGHNLPKSCSFPTQGS